MKDKEAEFLEEFKIEQKVFDKRTLLSIFELMKKGSIKTVESIVREGKESVVASGKDSNGNTISIKIYRTLHSDFKKMWMLLVNDPRFKGLKKDKWEIVKCWAKREFKNLNIAYSGGVSTPRPLDICNNVIVIEFIGQDDVPAPRLTDIELEDYQYVYDFILDNMIKLSECNLIHGDMSPYNIIIFDKPYIIDFSQAVTNIHPRAREFLQRDVENINRFFKNKGVKIDENLFNKLSTILKL